MFDRMTLLGVQRNVCSIVTGGKWSTSPDALLSQADDVPFAGDDFAGRDFAVKLFVPHVAAPLRHGLNLSQRHILSPGMFQRMTPKLVLVDDRAPVEQMIFRPGHRLF